MRRLLDGTVHPTHGWFPHGTDGLEHGDLEAVLEHGVAGDGRRRLLDLARPRGALPGDLERRHLQRAGGGEEDGCDPHVFFVWQLLLGSAESFRLAERDDRAVVRLGASRTFRAYFTGFGCVLAARGTTEAYGR